MYEPAYYVDAAAVAAAAAPAAAATAVAAAMLLLLFPIRNRYSMYTTRAHACTVTSAPITTLTTLSSSGARGSAIFYNNHVMDEFQSLVVEKR